MKQEGKLWPAIVHILVLCSFAIAQPLFDLLSRHAEFFIIRRSEPVDIILFVFILCGVLPAAVVLGAEAAGWLGQRVRQWAYGCVIACLTTAVVLQALKRLGELPGPALVAGATLVGIAAAFSYRRFLPVRIFLTTLSPAVLIFAGLFLFNSPVFRIVFAESDPEAASLQVKITTPIVLVIFDELPVVSLMDEHRRIDPRRYPNFAALARDATWFRNATTVDQSTVYAVPAILTGNYPDRTLLPTARDYPHNMFTLFGRSHSLKVFEPMTQLCPDRLCKRTQERLAKRMGRLLSDLPVVYLHLLLPEDLSLRFPSISQGWMDFVHGVAKEDVPLTNSALERWQEEIWQDRLQPFTDFVDALDSAVRPGFFFLHLLLPHVPYMYLPSGKIYTTDTALVGLEPNAEERWGTDEWAVIQSYQRHLLQVGFVDTLLGEILARLKGAGLYDRSLIVVTADHGASFRPGDARRPVTQTNFPDIMAVPLLIKAPHQREGVLSDRSVEAIDILPTIVDMVGMRLPWSVDGYSAFDLSLPERRGEIHVQTAQGRWTFDPTALEAKYATLARKLALFGSGAESSGFCPISLHPDLMGQHIGEVDVVEGANVQVQLDLPHLFTDVDPQTRFVPAHITGQVRSRWDVEDPPNLAIAINGTIRAVTRPWTFPVRGEIGRWSAVVDDTAFRAGHNDVEVFLVSLSGGRPVLARTLAPSYFLSEASEEGRATVISSQEASIPAIPHALQGWVDHSIVTDDHIELVGWAADVMHSQLLEAILIFVNGEFFYSGRTYLCRSDVVKVFNNPAFQCSGFSYAFPLGLFRNMVNPEVRLFAVSKNGVASELNYPQGYQWGKKPGSAAKDFSHTNHGVLGMY